MKKTLILFLCMILLFTFAGCRGESNILNGIWESELGGEKLLIIFMDNTCFLQDEDSIVNIDFTLEYNTGNLLIDDISIPFTVQDNELILENQYAKIVFNKDTKIKEADRNIKGIWNGPNGWMFAFVNEHVYIVDNNGNADYAAFSFASNEGAFKSRYWSYDVFFSVKDNLMDAKVTGWFEENMIFLRQD